MMFASMRSVTVGLISGGNDHVAPRDIGIAIERHGDGLPGNSEIKFAVESDDGGDLTLNLARQHHHCTSGAKDTARNGAAVAPKVVGASYTLHRQAQRSVRPLSSRVHGFEVVQQSRTRIPRHGCTALNDIFAAQ